MDANRPQGDFEDGDGEGQPQPRRFGGGKYGSLDEFEAGYSESFREVERLRANEAAAKAEADTYRRMLEADRSRPAPRERVAEPEYIPVGEEGVSRAHVQQLANDAARAAATQAVAEALRPLMMGATARTEMLNLHPDYAQREAEIHQFLAKTPRAMQLYQEVSQTNPVAALELAYSQYQAALPAPNPGTRQEEDRTRTQAGLPGAAAGAGRANESAESYNRKYQQLLAKAQETGDYTEFLAHRLSGVIPEGHLKRPI